MKIILVDAINCFVSTEGKIFNEMYELLESFSNKKIILTGANDEQCVRFGLDKMPYEVFTLKHNPEKTDPGYYKTLLKKYALTSDDVVYFEHSSEAVKSAQSVGINTHYYNDDLKDLKSLKSFLDKALG